MTDSPDTSKNPPGTAPGAGGKSPEAGHHEIAEDGATEKRHESDGSSAGPNRFLRGPRILPRPIRPGMSVSDLIRDTFLAYNAGRLREGARLLAERILRDDVTVGLSITGALTPAGLGLAALNPLLRGGYVDWVVSTGANLYHDTHFGLDLAMHQGSPNLDDVVLRRDGVVRIYDVLFDYRVLLSTDAFYREIVTLPPFQKMMSSAEFHHLAGGFVHEREKALGVADPCFLSTAFSCDVPIYTSSPGDSSIGMNVAAAALKGNRLTIDPNLDVNETAAIVLDAKRRGRSAVWILGGGSPKNFVLQTEPQIQEVLGIEEEGHDYFLQITDARPDTGGLSGATPAEAVSWGKVDPEMLPHAVVVYADSTIALPLLTAYILENVPPRPLKRLYKRRDEMVEHLRDTHLRSELTRQQAMLQQKVAETQAQLEARFHETHVHLEEKLREKQAQFQAELSKVQEKMQKLLPQIRTAGRKAGEDAEE